MYQCHRIRIQLRDTAPPYGTPRAWSAADDGEDDDRFPADDVLRDLPTARDARAVARILTRYAVLRCWLLRRGAAPAALLDHAEQAALEHLSSVPGWDEGLLLHHLVGVPPGEGAGPLAAAAEHAWDAGHYAGASALRAAARDATEPRWRNGGREGGSDAGADGGPEPGPAVR